MLELGNLSTMIGSGIIGGDFVGELNVDILFTWATDVDFLVSFLSLVFLWQLFGMLVL